MNALSEKTIADFGDQWTRYTGNEGFYGTTKVLADTFGPLMSLSQMESQRIAEIGSGTGRIVKMLLESGASHVFAIEPSEAFKVLKSNTSPYSDRVTLIKTTGDQIPKGLNLDLVLSIGVIHHIPEPAPVMKAAFNSLRSGGKCLIWVYGAEGQGLAVSIIRGLRAISTRLPHWALAVLSQLLTIILDLYSIVAKRVPLDLPLKEYIVGVIGKFPRDKRVLVIYDQLKPAYAKYYKEEEVRLLFREAGFKSIKLYHRRHYSWTAVGTKP